MHAYIRRILVCLNFERRRSSILHDHIKNSRISWNRKNRVNWLQMSSDVVQQWKCLQRLRYDIVLFTFSFHCSRWVQSSRLHRCLKFRRRIRQVYAFGAWRCPTSMLLWEWYSWPPGVVQRSFFAFCAVAKYVWVPNTWKALLYSLCHADTFLNAMLHCRCIVGMTCGNNVVVVFERKNGLLHYGRMLAFLWFANTRS